LLCLSFGVLPAASSLSAQGTERAALVAYVDSTTSLMEHYSIKRDEVDWPSLRRDARARVDTAAQPDTGVAYAAVREALKRLGDHHSRLLDPTQTRRMNASDPSSAPQNEAPEVRPISGRLGYVRIPPYDGLDSVLIQRYAVSLQDRIRAIAKQARCGWVVDLRGNTGGNMWPMLAGIGPLLGDGLAGRFVRVDTTFTWGYREGYAWESSDTIVHVPNPLVIAPAPWVAVLTDSNTASSGEVIALSFRGRPHTRSFGEQTAGLTTGNQDYPLPDGSILFLTVSVEADRTGRRYGGPVLPDSALAPAEALPAATSWLRANGCTP
jgi:carboxyl-terminal processing protease